MSNMVIPQISKDTLQTEKKSLILKISKQIELINSDIEQANLNIKVLLENDAYIQNYIIKKKLNPTNDHN